MPNLNAKEYASFESIKHVDENGFELWYARELAPVLEYTQWRNFAKVIDKAMLACKNSGYDTDECFAEVSKISKMPNGGVKQVIDFELTRYACYLIVQNGDPRKEVIALGQTYFAIQTRRREGFITILSKNIETVLGAEFDMDTDAIDAKLGTLQDEIMRLASSKSDYDNLAVEIHRLRSIKQETQEHNAQRQTKRQRISEMTEFLDMQSGIIAEYDDKLTRQLIEQITVFADKLQVSFKSGVDIEVEI